MFCLQVRHTVQWEAVWRNLSCLSRTVPFEVREQSGHSLKSSLIHSICMDRRKGNIFPTSGNLFELKSEFAGVGGDVGFLKNEIKIQSNLSLFKDFVSY
jgi:outer membrane protein insertion porin family